MKAKFSKKIDLDKIPQASHHFDFEWGIPIEKIHGNGFWCYESYEDYDDHQYFTVDNVYYITNKSVEASVDGFLDCIRLAVFWQYTTGIAKGDLEPDTLYEEYVDGANLYYLNAIDSEIDYNHLFQAGIVQVNNYPNYVFNKAIQLNSGINSASEPFYFELY